MSKKKFQVIKNATHEEGEYALYDVANKTVIISGDYYHDKVYDYITGFFRGMDYNGLDYIREDIKIYPEDNFDLWNSCDFYDGRQD